MTTICTKCNLPIFFGPAGLAAPQCQCWAQYDPAPNAAKQPGCVPLVPLTEADVRRIVREELAKQGEQK